ncbi:MAG: TldD/PmbA family protein [candidate division Zixibacteria bacterium]|nr:TldD/PmbA family protein [candidate division Zixibacteria bacterium]
MIKENKILTTLRTVINKSEADQTEAVFNGSQSGLTRFANSYIHQNVAQANNTIYFRTAIDGKIGVAATNSFKKADLLKTLNNSLLIAKHQPSNPDFKGFPKPCKYKKIQTFFEPTAKYSPKQRAEVILKICREADKFGLKVAGAFSTSTSELAVVNSNGLAAYQPVTAASINVVAMTDTSSGFASGLSRRVVKIPFDLLAQTAIKKCLDSQNPENLEPGKYDVILEPEAIAEIMNWLTYIAFGAKPYFENTSILSKKIGKKIMGEDVTIYDDAVNTSGLAVPFDFEGVAKRKVFMVKKGIANSPVYDSLYAGKANVRSTGHALRPGSGEGPMSGNIFIAAGKKSKESLIAGVKNGILVTRFHYINGLLDTTKALMTGMTRDGTFRIKNGKINGGVKNLRFTESITKAFSRVGGISKETKLCSNWWDDFGCCSSPTIMIKKFNFSGKTEF